MQIDIPLCSILFDFITQLPFTVTEDTENWENRKIKSTP